VVYYSIGSTSIFLDEMSIIICSVLWWEAMEVSFGVTEAR
jgi:hypothetical protein